MSGWLYLIKNKDLYKIGITKNLENRMREKFNSMRKRDAA